MTNIETPPQPDFMGRAKKLVSHDYNETMPYGVAEKESKPEDFYVVWFAKTLGNWKALVSTDLEPGLYWEVTHNGSKLETYVDRYVKKSSKTYSYDALPAVGVSLKATANKHHDMSVLARHTVKALTGSGHTVSAIAEMLAVREDVVRELAK